MKDDKGNQFSFKGDPINSGGEGKIYLTSQSRLVAKIYDKPPTPEQISKLKKMIANPPNSPPTHGNHVAIAWPTSLIWENQQCLGFLMPQIGRNVQLIEVYNPKSRKAVLPKCDWVFLHTTARNFAEIVNSLHKSDYVIGDIKPQNILVDNQALVSVVDCDSFQVKDGAKVYRCHVATEGFTPPELLGVDTSKVTQTVYHDRYRVGLIIYHLLFTRHPFDEGTWMGSGEHPSQVELMKKGLWLHNSQGLLQSHKVTIPLQVVHPKLQELFKKCFNDGHKDAIKRPSAEEWSAALKLSIDDLTSCGKVDNHKYSKNYGKCYWCERKAALNIDIFQGEAPKTKLQPPPSGGTNIFFPPTSPPPGVGTPTVLPPATPTSPSQPQFPQPDPKTKKVIGGVLLSIGVVCLVVGYASWVGVVGIVVIIIGFSCFSD
jgi:DNA-binding helix-hairpin-helix protein with protein kinase domain